MRRRAEAARQPEQRRCLTTFVAGHESGGKQRFAGIPYSCGRRDLNPQGLSPTGS